jgi:hypothetical protein
MLPNDPTPEEIRALCEQIKHERAAGLVTAQVRDSQGQTAWVARPRLANSRRGRYGTCKPRALQQSRSDEFVMPVYRLRIS